METHPVTETAVQVLVPKAELIAGQAVAPIIPRTIEEVARVAKAILTAGLMPSSYEGKNPEETISRVIIGIMKAAEVGLPPITGLSTICIINNRPSIYGDGAVALCQRSNAVEWVKQEYTGIEDSDAWTARFEIKRRNQEEPYVGTFSVKQAKRAGLWQNPKRQPWISYPSRMLMARARAYALREGFADCLSGLSIAEEIQDLPEGPKAITNTDFLADAPTQPAIEHQPETVAADPLTAELDEVLGDDAIDRAIARGELLPDAA